MSALREILSQRRLQAVFQPIIDLRNGDLLGFEGLIRGPEESKLHMPDALFRFARKAELSVELERLCRETILNRFTKLDLVTKRLFINSSILSMEDALNHKGAEVAKLTTLQIPAECIVIEMTEHQLISDFSLLREMLAEFRRAGFSLAMSNLAEGFFRRDTWSDVRPEFVKIDRQFVSGLAENPLKFTMVRAMQEIAELCGSRLIAVGIETEAEFVAIRDMGIRYGQGFLIGRPLAKPSLQISDDVRFLLESTRHTAVSSGHGRNNNFTQVRQLLRYLEPIPPEMECDKVYQLFEGNPQLRMIPVVDQQKPIGIITRYSLIDRFARRYQRELLGKKPCRSLMDEAPLIVEQSTSVQELARIIGSSEEFSVSDDFIVTHNGSYLGTGSSRELIKLITDIQINSARYANPLTQLPGNVPINEHIEHLLHAEVSFVACYADLDSFKPYNDVYGYQRGDEVILMVGKLLAEVIDPRLDFLGHIGGDDFMILFQSESWEQRCRRALELFDSHIILLLNAEHIVMSGFMAEDRRGNNIFHSLPALSLGCVPVKPNHFKTHHEVAAVVAEAKHQAKKTRGSSLFIDRRTH
ncbi:MAG: GGDEF domain-containing protein [Rhodoferax sp.]|nr:GGDEF domain-containing protein [Rhodoferax sp.]